MKSFEKKIYLGLVLLVLASTPVLISNFLSWREMVAEQKELITQHAQGLLDVENLRLASQAPARLGPLYVLSGDPRILVALENANRVFEGKIKQLQKDSLDQQERTYLTRVQLAFDEQKKIAAEGDAMRQKGASALQVREFFEAHEPKEGDFGGVALRNLASHRESKFAKAKLEMSRTTDRIIIILAITSLLSLGFSAIIVGLLVKMVNEKKSLDAQREQLWLKEQKISAIRKETLETVSHDLKTPLTSLKLRLQMLQRSGGPNAGHALRSVESMEKLIRDLLDKSSLDAGHLNLQLRRCNLLGTLREVAGQLEPLAQAKSIQFEFSAAELPEIDCDPARIQQVVTNLLSNAIKFTPKGGRVSVRAEASQGELTVSVKDNGPGIPEEKIPHLFERYWQDSASASHGHGLGLAIAGGLAEAHDGKITVLSEVGKGTEFCLRLPIHRKELLLAGNPAHHFVGADLASSP